MKVLAVVGAVILSAALLVGLWFGGWWLQRQIVQKKAEIRTLSHEEVTEP